MNLEEIESLLKMLNEGNNETVKSMLEAERNRILHTRNQFYKNAFKKYIEEIVLTNIPNWSNLYSYDESMLTFTNGISIYKLYENFELLDEIKEVECANSSGIVLLKEAKTKEIDGKLEQFKILLGNDKLLVENESESYETQITMYETGNIVNSFSMKQINYMNRFLGGDARVYMSAKQPVAYAESDKGSGYVLGLKKKNE